MPDEPRCPVVAIVGAGMAGTLTAVQLLRHATGPLEIALVDRSGDFGPGVAYSTRSDEHLLNQPAERMSAFADSPAHFRDWTRHDDPAAFLPRRLYGDYLRSVLKQALRDRPAHTRLHRIHGSVIELAPHAGLARLQLADGRTIACDRVVLATGPPPARRPATLPIDPRVIADPWSPTALSPPPRGATIVLIGTGLTAVDVALSLGGHARVAAVSRRGMLPFAHMPGLRAPAPPPSLPRPPVDLEALERTVRTHAARMQRLGYDWRDVVDGLRPLVPDLWRALPVEERRRFLRTRARAWEVRRHRMAPAVAARVRALRARGRLALLAGEVHGARATDAGIDVAIGARTITAARVIICTGPADDIARAREPLLRALIAAGHAVPDPLGLGLRTSATGALLDRQGHPSPVLYTLGALRRGELWESTAAAEIRTQALELAIALRASLEQPTNTTRPVQSVSL